MLKILSMKKSLPRDTVREILLILPIKSLIRFKCVSKAWAAMISDPLFIKNHLNLAIKDYDNHGIIFGGSMFFDFVRSVDIKAIFDTNPGYPVGIKLNLPPPDAEACKREMLGSCHGLVCFKEWRCSIGQKTKSGMFYFYNPSTREIKRVPDDSIQPQLLMVNSGYARYGFGYDFSTNDYKLVKLYSDHENKKVIVSIYSLRTNTWRKLERCSSYGYQYEALTFPKRRLPAFPNRILPHLPQYCNGVVHWLSYYYNNDYDYESDDNYSCHISSLDLSDETFRDLPSPNGVVDLFSYRLAVFGEYLCLSRNTDIASNYFEVWVMKEYGVRESWTKLSVRIHDYCWGHQFCNSGRRYSFNVDPLVFYNGWGHQFCNWGRRYSFNVDPLVLYNSKKEEEFSRILLICGDNISAKTYVKSLVSPNWCSS